MYNLCSGDQFTIVIHDMYGFECFNRNGLEQLMINTLNEQLQYHYNQRIFVNEMLEMVRQSNSIQKFKFFICVFHKMFIKSDHIGSR